MLKYRNPGLTPMQERYCQEYVKDLHQTKAAERAGYKCPGVMGAQLMAMPKIQARVAELQAEVAERNDITIDGVCEELELIRDGAKQSEQWSAASHAEMGRAKVAGLLVERYKDETERSKSDADMAKEIAATAPEKRRHQIEQIVTALLVGNVEPMVSMMDRLERIQPRAV